MAAQRPSYPIFTNVRNESVNWERVWFWAFPYKYAIIDAFILIDYTKPPKYYSKPQLAMINKHGIGALIVVDEDNTPIGLIHFHDLLRIGVA